jgi:hypothetical protein
MPSGAVKQLAARKKGGWSPLDLPDLWAWWDADDGDTITEASGLVEEWGDKSGDSRTLSQAASGARPLLVANERNGRDIIRFSTGGTADWMGTADPGSAAAQPWWIICAIKYVNGVNIVSTRVASGGNATFYVTANNWAYFAGTARTSSTAANDSTWRTMIVKFSGADSVIYRDGSSISTANPGTSGFRGIALATWGPLAADFASFDAGEVIAVNGALTTADLNNAGQYLSTRWDTGWTDIA